MLETRPFDPVDYIRSREEAGQYMEAALGSGEPDVVVDALDIVARWCGAAEPRLSAATGLHLVGPKLEELGFRLRVQPADATSETPAEVA